MMKNLLLTIVLLTSIVSFGQNIQWVNSNKKPMADTVVLEYYLEELNSSPVYLDGMVFNSTNEGVDVGIRREVLAEEYSTGHQDAVCWGAECSNYFDETVSLWQTPVSSHQYIKPSGFYKLIEAEGQELIKLKHNEVVGNTIIKYTLFSGSVNFDSVVVIYALKSKAMQEEENNSFDFKVYPNPVSNKLSIDFSDHISVKNAKIVVRNIIGKTIMVLPVVQNSSHQNLFLGDLRSGIYFVNLEENGQLLQSKKILKR
jgi:hypothetical protein